MKYVFWMILETGEEIRWSGLTLTQAEKMYKWTDEHLPYNVSSYGWEDME